MSIVTITEINSIRFSQRLKFNFYIHNSKVMYDPNCRWICHMANNTELALWNKLSEKYNFNALKATEEEILKTFERNFISKIMVNKYEEFLLTILIQESCKLKFPKELISIGENIPEGFYIANENIDKYKNSLVKDKECYLEPFSLLQINCGVEQSGSS